MTILITGAAAGIGKAIATQYIEDGHQVIGIDYNQARADQTRAELGDNLRFIIADLSKHQVLESVIQQINTPLDVVIHNAGISEVGYFQATNPDNQRRVIDINLIAPMILTRHLLAHKLLTERASVVFVSSLSHYVSYPGASVYGATKTGLASYARTLSVAYPHLHVLTVYPGPTRTEHARQYSPDNSREDTRMSPDVLAEKIVGAIESRDRILIPSPANWVFAILGRIAPALTNFAMRKTVLEKFPKPTS
ncbi:MAG: SDR family NAD(P)-dependent oxidoreductase [Chloroflexota bacterium]